MINSLRPSDAKRSRSVLGQVTACWLTAPKQYLNQCWLLSEVLWYSPEDHITGNDQHIALTISRCLFYPNNSPKTLIAHPYGVFNEFEVWPRFYRWHYCVVCNIVIHCTVIYWESILYQLWKELQSYIVINYGNISQVTMWKSRLVPYHIDATKRESCSCSWDARFTHNNWISNRVL